MEFVSGVVAFCWAWKIQIATGLCVYMIASSLRKISEGLTVGFFRAIFWFTKLPFRKKSPGENRVLISILIIVGIAALVGGHMHWCDADDSQGPQGWHVGDEVIVDSKDHRNIGCKGKLGAWLPKRKAWRVDGGYGWMVIEESNLTNLSKADR